MNFSKIIQKSNNHVQNIIFISTECPFHTFLSQRQNFNITFCKNFIGLQRSIGHKKSTISNFKNL